MLKINTALPLRRLEMSKYCVGSITAVRERSPRSRNDTRERRKSSLSIAERILLLAVTLGEIDSARQASWWSAPKQVLHTNCVCHFYRRQSNTVCNFCK